MCHTRNAFWMIRIASIRQLNDDIVQAPTLYVHLPHSRILWWTIINAQYKNSKATDQRDQLSYKHRFERKADSRNRNETLLLATISWKSSTIHMKCNTRVAVAHWLPSARVLHLDYMLVDITLWRTGCLRMPIKQANSAKYTKQIPNRVKLRWRPTRALLVLSDNYDKEKTKGDCLIMLMRADTYLHLATKTSAPYDTKAVFIHRKHFYDSSREGELHRGTRFGAGILFACRRSLESRKPYVWRKYSSRAISKASSAGVLTGTQHPGIG